MTKNNQPMFGLESLNSVLKSISIDYERRVLEKLYERGFKRYNDSYYFILNELSTIDKPAICADMAHKRGVTTQTIGKQVNLMVHDGYITKSKSPKDVRSNHVSLTKFGHSLIQALIDINGEIEGEYNTGIKSIREKLISVAEKNDIKTIIF